MRISCVALLAASLLGLAGEIETANASLIVSASVGGSPSGTFFANFDNLPLSNSGGTSSGVGVSFSGDGRTYQGSIGGITAAPYLSNNNGTLFGNPSNGPDATSYLSTGIGTATLTFAAGQTYLGLLWGSVDNYNTLSFYSGGNPVGSIGGTAVWAAANGDQGANGTFYVNITSDLVFDTVVASSTQYAFEFDNVSYNNAVIQDAVPTPEPGTLALLGCGLAGAIGFGRRKARKSAS